MKKHTFFLLLISNGQHLSVYMAAHSGYQISDINIFLDVVHVCLCTQKWWMGGFTDHGQSHFIFKTTWHLHYRQESINDAFYQSFFCSVVDPCHCFNRKWKRCMDHPIMGNSILQASSSGIVQFIQLLMIYHKAGNFHGCKFSWIFQKPVLPKFSQFLILQQGSRPMTTPQLQQRRPCKPIREQNLNPSAIWLDGTVLALATGWCKNLEVMTLPCTKASLCVTQHAFAHGCTYACMGNSIVCVQVASFTGLFQPGSNSSGCPHLLHACEVEDWYPDSGLTDCWMLTHWRIHHCELWSKLQTTQLVACSCKLVMEFRVQYSLVQMSGYTICNLCRWGQTCTNEGWNTVQYSFVMQLV